MSQRASLYARLSRAADGSNLSQESMLSAMRDLAESHGLEVVAEHFDNGKSGAVRDRPEFVAWLDDARQGRADYLVAFHADRLTREGVNAAAMVLDVIEGKDPETGAVVRKPVRLISCDGLDSQRDAEAFRWRFVIAAEVARGERERIKARTAASRRALAAEGRWPGGRVPYGYSVDRSGEIPTLVHEPAEVEAIRKAANDLLGGVPLGRIARRMTAEGIPTRESGRVDAAGVPLGKSTGVWRRAVLRQILSGDAVLGRITRHGEPLRDGDGNALTPWQPILDLDTRDAIRQRLADAAKNAPKGRAPARLLSGLLTCASCGSHLHVGGPTESRAYRCGSYGGDTECPSPVTIRAAQSDDEIESRFLAAYGSWQTFERRVTAARPSGLAEVEDRIAALAARLAKAVCVEDVERLQAAQAERDSLLAIPVEPVVELVPTGRTFAHDWDAGDLQARRELLADVFESIEVRPSGRGRRFDPARLVETPHEGFDVDYLAGQLD